MKELIPDILPYFGHLIRVGGLLQKLMSPDLRAYYAKALKNTAKRLEEKYDRHIFGGNTEKTLLGQLDLIVQHFEPYGQLDDLHANLAEEIQFNTLPSDFYETFKSTFLEEALKYVKLKLAFADYLQAHQIDDIHQVTQQIPEINKNLLRVLELITTSPVPLPEKTEYSFNDDYFITRKLLPITAGKLNEKRDNTLWELIENEEKQRVVVLGFAGSGKSVEIDFVCSMLSKKDSASFPIKIDLGHTDISSTGLEGFFSKKYPGWDHYNDELVILIDGLDEVSDSEADTVRRQILTLSEIKSNSKIIVACRNNGYHLADGGLLKGFEHYQLPPFSYHELHQYVNRRLASYEQTQLFLTQIGKLGFGEDTATPFYLVNLVDYYQNNEHTLPSSRLQLFEYLIERRKGKEKSKSHDRWRIERIESRLDEAIEKTAFIFQCTDNNFLSSRDLQKVIGNSEILDVVRHSYMLDNGGEGKWRFEHNNFKEYLSARYLSGMNIEFIKEMLFVSEIQRIKPRWLNTLGFLISIIPRNDATARSLIDFLKVNDPESLIRIERDKIELPIREDLFIHLFETFVGNELYPTSPKFNTEDLGYFVSDSETIWNILIEQVNVGKPKFRVDLSLFLLARNDYRKKNKGFVKDRLNDLLFSEKTEVGIKINCLNALSWFEINDQTLYSALLNHQELSNDEFREALYHSILASDLIEDFLPFVFNTYCQRGHSHDLKYSVLFYLSREASFHHLLQRFNENELLYARDNELGDLLEEMREKEIFSQEIASLVYENLKHHLQYYPDTKFKKPFLDYISHFGLTDLFFDRLIVDYFERKEEKCLHCMHLLLTIRNADVLLTAIIQRNLAHDHVIEIRALLSYAEDKESFDYFYTKLNKQFDNEFLWQKKQTTFYQRTIQAEIDLLFDRKKFLELSTNFFITPEIALDRHELYSNQDFRRNQDSTTAGALNVLRDIVGERSWSHQELVDYVSDDNKWDFLKARVLVKIIRNGNNGFLSSKEGLFLTNWAKTKVLSDSFTKTFFKNDYDEWRYYEINLLAASICQFLRLDLLEEDYYKLIKVDCYWVPYIERQDPQEQVLSTSQLNDSKLTSYVISKIGEEKVEVEILRSLRYDDLFEDVIHNLLRYLRLRGRKEHVNLFLNRSLERLRATALVWYVELGGDLSLVCDEVKRMNGYDKWTLIDAVMKKDGQILTPYLNEVYEKETDNEERARILTYLLESRAETGLDKMKDWILTNKRFPTVLWATSANKSSDPRKIEIFKAVYIDSLKNDYGGERSVYGRQVYLEVLVELGKENVANYRKVSKFLKAVLSEHPEVSLLHGTIAKLEFDFYKGQTNSFSLEEAILMTESKRIIETKAEQSLTSIIDITKHQFQIALSFPGEVRGYVEQVESKIKDEKGSHYCFYDNKYKAQLARPSLDLLLQNVYSMAKLLVVFLGEKYQEKNWCGVEFRVIRQVVMNREFDRVMFVKMDDGAVEGIFQLDGYIDGKSHTPAQVAEFILERAGLLE